MIDMTIDMQASVPSGRSHFHGNGNCDATRSANKRADRRTGMESELVPYNAQEQAYGVQGSEAMTPAGGAAPGSAGEQSGMSGGNGTSYGTEHVWTGEAAEGMTTIPQESFNDPLTAGEAARNSWRALLARNVGRTVLVRFLIGTQNIVTVEGELYEVGTDYLVIFQPLWDSHITADLYSVKFVEFREPPGQMLN